MTIRYLPAAVCALTLSALACSRQAESRAPSEAPPLTPAAGAATPTSRAANRPRCGEHFKAFDEDDDGRISRAEFDAQPHAHPDPAAVFRARDRDADGSLTEAELCSGFRGAPASDAAPGPGQGMGPGAAGPRSGAPMRHHRAPGPMMGARCEGHFDAFDADHDGKLSPDEFAAWPHAHGDADTLFAERDLDHDGTITREEFCSAWKR
ncbi:MAG TPA: EF-hand domain-containing protein [Polyangiaceae bacterium]|nr:EF-hand domain-containing protein [Polyangiaceae bacterium]